MAGNPKLFYWGVRARNVLPILVAKVGGIQLDFEPNVNLDAMRHECPFGQLPILKHKDFTMGQSLAIVRYVARLAHLQGESDKEFGLSEQLVQEFDDIYSQMAKAQYGADKKVAWDHFFNTELPKHMAHLEKLVQGDNFTGKLLCGDLSIFTICLLATDLEANCLNNFPKIKAFFDKTKQNPKVAEVLAMPLHPYFKRA